ncbi:MAG: membrane protein insertase YidC [Cyanobacteria bacterium SZAS TMP-1]|nr:membrane protein insertase YidC [Cyanobacteria bacterium SZAS TMP-1]
MDITYQIMIPVLLWIQKYTQSYGLSIIVLTLVVRIVVWPLVASSTKNMKRMQLLQPIVKGMQAKYKDDPEMLQRKMMEFYAKNKVNPVLGCLPMLVQLPLLFALFGTFSGPPFGDKAIDVKVNVVESRDAGQVKHSETSNNNSPYVSRDGRQAKVIVFPGESVVTEGQKIDFATRAVEGSVPDDFKVKWIVRHDGKFAHTDEATIDDDGHATFLKKGEYHVEAIVDGVAKSDSFGPITSLGKKPSGMELLKPENFDQLALIVLFGISMYFSSKISMASSGTKPEDMDENQRVMQDSMKWMPLGMTVMFIGMPLPTGVLVYMSVSNAMQTLQTVLLMNAPVPPLMSVDDDDVPPPTTPGGASKESKANGNSNGQPKTIDIGPAPKNGKADEGAKIKFNQADPVGEVGEKRKPTKKKKKK